MEDKPDWIRYVEACMDEACRALADIDELDRREAAAQAAEKVEFMISWYAE